MQDSYMWTHLRRIKREGREESHIAMHVLMPVMGKKEGRRSGKPQSAGQLRERLSQVNGEPRAETAY